MLLIIILFLLLILAVSIWQRKCKGNDAKLDVDCSAERRGNGVMKLMQNKHKWFAALLIAGLLDYKFRGAGDASWFACVCLVMAFKALDIKIHRLSYRPVIWPNGKKGPYMWQDPEE